MEQADRARVRVATAAGTATLTIGTLADSAEQAGTRLAAAYRRRHPGVNIRIREADFTDPTTGLRAGLVDVALTRAPFDDTGISTHVLRSDPVGVVLRTDDPLADRDALYLSDLADRRWCLLPEDTDPIWRAYWNGTTPTDRTHDDRIGRDRDAPTGRDRAGLTGRDHDGLTGRDRAGLTGRDHDGPIGRDRDGPVVRTVHECIQAVIWSGTVGLTPLVHELPDGLTSVPLLDMPPSRLVVAWNSADSSPLIRSFTQLAVAGLR
ncbi:LysR substrate-binding domain-containing protein [Actinoallomurus purpureus]|nr:LysR substrate-binding domain-containing protein [Actinoallomurus purpureus]